MPITSVKSVGMTVADLDRSIDFYTTVLSFTKIADRQIMAGEVTDESYLTATGNSAPTTIKLRIVELQLGDETIELTESLSGKGRPIPPDSRSNDRWFQHIAIVVADMDRAYQHLCQYALAQPLPWRIDQISPSPQTLPDWNPVAGGIQAFYFRDPDGHNLELIHFPAAKGDPKWQHPTDALFLGIDHTAIVVADTAASRAFYCDLLGMAFKQESNNFGVEQERLSGIPNAKVRISSLAAPAGIGIELLEYLEPDDGRAIPTDTEFNDLWCCQTTIAVVDAIETVQQLEAVKVTLAAPSPGSVLALDRQLLIRDPDGHLIRVADRSSQLDGIEQL